ncbi:16S rRNA m(7)G-527 methyltransferase [Fontimonas thermophila]|uniref:Ribosomal RNA small subunit methyltransferase G n=1 Tax=Fontimonas thermophila TaxID=1076937 RepID=A0A1I2JUZ0_9GAMM|nr:16S rRNA (guanine(527)-N(7))-methyltransferase RsmG [Fontimonas thermophila]SFF56581.1 16S rRNA m(7)G-527 methyltransferase [Fontimonas thermophila]
MPLPRPAGSSVLAPAALRAPLEAGLRALGQILPEDAIERLLAYLAELHKWNAAYNLTAIRDPRQMVTRHILDSLAVLPLMRGRVLDVGAGAGLPGIVLAIGDPALHVTVLDSNGKKARFMRHAVRSLTLANVEVAEARVETYAAAAPFDRIVSRAFASLSEFVTLTASQLAPDGHWIAMKGRLDSAELAAVPANVTIREIRRLRVPGLNEERHAIIAARTP